MGVRVEMREPSAGGIATGGGGGGGHGGRVTAKLLTSCRIADTTRKGSWYQIQVGPRPGRQCTVPADP